MRIFQRALHIGGLWLLFGALFAFGCRQAAAQNTEDQIKAAFLGRFLNYVGAEHSAQAGQPAPQVCVTGETPISKALMNLAMLQRANEQAFVYTHVRESSEFSACAILFIAKSRSESLPEVLAEVQNDGVLTVSDMPGFAERGGMIELIEEKGYIRFVINRKSAESAGIVFSSQLLALAKRLID